MGSLPAWGARVAQGEVREALITQRNGALSVLQRGEAEKSNVGKVVNRGCGVPDGFSVVPPYMNQRAVVFGQGGWGWC